MRVSFAALQASWAEWLLEGLMAAGVRRVVVSPGSRSTPLVLAIARAEKAGRLDVEVIVDERVAAFFALGQARVTNQPGLLVCTSGTAGTHYLPALAEAAESRIPLLAMTADRPPELRGRGASQTIDQPGMFGRFVRRSFEIGPAEPDPRAVDGLVRTAMLAVHATRWPDPGPVHLNVALRKPLEPDGGRHRAVEALSRRVSNAIWAGAGPSELPAVIPPASLLDAVAERLRASPRGLLVLGPCSPAAAPSPASVNALARATGFPVLAEATSQRRFGRPGLETCPEPCLEASEALFGSRTFVERGAPEIVLQIGEAPTGRALGAWIATSGVERVVLARHGVPDPFNQATRVVIGDLEPALQGLVQRLDGGRDDEDDTTGTLAGGESGSNAAWAGAVSRAAAKAASLAADLSARPGSQGEAVRVAVDVLPAGGILVVGNSMPVRDVDLYVPPGPRDITVLSQRGAAGIDGLLAGAAGAAAASRRPVLALLGDVSFQHDVGGLAAAAGIETPLAIVVVSNGGGRLFEVLPVHGLPGARSAPPGGRSLFDRFFLTPPDLDVGTAARAFGVRAVRTADGPELAEALKAALAAPGASVVEAVVDADGADAVREISNGLDAWLAGPEGCFPA